MLSQVPILIVVFWLASGMLLCVWHLFKAQKPKTTYLSLGILNMAVVFLLPSLPWGEFWPVDVSTRARMANLFIPVMAVQLLAGEGLAALVKRFGKATERAER